MKRRFQSEAVRTHFDTAWHCLPPQVQKALRGFIRHVDEVDRFDGIYLYARNEITRAVEIIDGPLTGEGVGYAAYCIIADRRFCDLIFASRHLLSGTEGYAVAICLHEIAHAQDYFLNGKQTVERGHYLSEIHAWNQALEWAAMLANAELRTDAWLHIQAAIRNELQEELDRVNR